MRIMTLKGLAVALILAGVGLVMSACNTSKATIDTFGKFTSSTSPGEWIDADGVIQERQKARLFTAVVFENLEQDIARGNGEYLKSLAVLLKIPAGDQAEFSTRSQSEYPLLFATNQRTAESLLAMLTGKSEEPQADRQ